MHGPARIAVTAKLLRRGSGRIEAGLLQQRIDELVLTRSVEKRTNPLVHHPLLHLGVSRGGGAVHHDERPGALGGTYATHHVLAEVAAGAELRDASGVVRAKARIPGGRDVVHVEVARKARPEACHRPGVIRGPEEEEPRLSCLLLVVLLLLLPLREEEVADDRGVRDIVAPVLLVRGVAAQARRGGERVRAASRAAGDRRDDDPAGG